MRNSNAGRTACHRRPGPHQRGDGRPEPPTTHRSAGRGVSRARCAGAGQRAVPAGPRSDRRKPRHHRSAKRRPGKLTFSCARDDGLKKAIEDSGAKADHRHRHRDPRLRSPDGSRSDLRRLRGPRPARRRQLPTTRRQGVGPPSHGRRRRNDHLHRISPLRTPRTLRHRRLQDGREADQTDTGLNWE